MTVFIALGFGLLIGWTARLVAPGQPRLTWSETIVLGLAGAGLGFGVVNLLGDRDYFDLDVETIIASILGALVLLAGAEIVRRRRGMSSLARRRLPSEVQPRTPVRELIGGGETDTVEFKSTARRNLHSGERDDQMEMNVAKTVAGFLNGTGGTLLIGVDDEGVVLGIELDYEFLKQPDTDRYELWLRDHLQRTLGAVAPTQVAASFESFGTDRTVCRLDVGRGDVPTFLDMPGGARTADFYVRVGNSTRKLATDEVLTYEKQRWS